MECADTRCRHMSWLHSTVTYPAYRQPCAVCLNCGRRKPGPGKDCCMNPKMCPCNNFQGEAS